MADVTLRRVGIMSVGDMGAGFGDVMHQNGLEVYTCLAGRSDLTRLRAREAGFIDTPDLESLVSQVDLILSIIIPDEATRIAEQIADAMIRTGAKPPYADVNAIAPNTVRGIESIIRDAGAKFIDASIIGGPPKKGYTPLIACSGPDTAIFQALADYELNVPYVGAEIGQASGLKMVYAASTKGTTALWTELLTVARILGLEDVLRAEVEESPVYTRTKNSIGSMPNRSRRWVGEMEEIAKTFEDVGMTPKILHGAAEMYDLVGQTPLGDLTTRDPNPTLDDIIDALVKRLSERQS